MVMARRLDQENLTYIKDGVILRGEEAECELLQKDGEEALQKAGIAQRKDDTDAGDIDKDAEGVLKKTEDDSELVDERPAQN